MLDDDDRGDSHGSGGPGSGNGRGSGPSGADGPGRTTIANDAGGTTSSWMRTPVPAYDRELPADLCVDVCVIGAGIAGLSTAYHLARAGLEVAVIDDGPIGGGETARTSAHLASALDDRFHHLERIHGAEGARLAAASHAGAIDDIERIVREHRIDCGFRRVDGYLFTAPGADSKILDAELQAARRAGLTVEMLTRAPWPSFDTGPCLCFADQAELHPLQYLVGLAAAFVERGGRIYTGVHATDIGEGTVAVSIARAGAERTITAPSVVVCTNPPITSRVSMSLRQAAYRTYVIAARIAASTIPPGLYWDTVDPYHYVRTVREPDGDLLLVGGEDHRVGQADDAGARWQRLEDWARERFPIGPTVDRWSGQVMEPNDGLAFIGRWSGSRERGVYLATGDSGHGLTHGALAGRLLTDLILGRDNPLATLYDPHRTTLRAIGTLVSEALSSSAPYTDWLKRGDVKHARDIAPGTGALLRQGLHLLAVYRDPAGTCHARSATCPHLGGVVQWNSAESSWDCPCHGSRFTAEGKLVAGPANSDLAPAKLDED